MLREFHLILMAALALAPSLPARAADSSFSQKDAQTNALNQNSQGSDDSLQSSIPYGMQALMDLAGGKLTSAVKNGYNAYGKYRNAENLDRLKDHAALMANAMQSIDQAPTYSMTPTNTTYRRLDPKFLHQGDADKISAEFEKQTGMKRETFLTEMANVSEQKIKRSDPMMIDKAFSRFESFLQKIPNQEFRKNAEKGIAMVPDTMRRGMVAQAVTKLAGMFADAGPAPAANESTITELTKNKLADAGATTPVAPGANASAVAGAEKDGAKANEQSDITRDPASSGGGEGQLTDAVPGASDSKGINGGSGKNGAEGAVAAALAAQGSNAGGSDESIFQQVTKRYRILTPLLGQKP